MYPLLGSEGNWERTRSLSTSGDCEQRRIKRAPPHLPTAALAPRVCGIGQSANALCNDKSGAPKTADALSSCAIDGVPFELHFRATSVLLVLLGSGFLGVVPRGKCVCVTVTVAHADVVERR